MTPVPSYDSVEFGMQLDAGLGPVVVAGFVRDGRFALVVDDGDPDISPTTSDGPLAALPLVLADLAGLGPRDAHKPDAPVLLVEQLDSEDGRVALAAAWDEEVTVGTPLEGDAWALWSASVAWEAGGERVEDGLVVVDGFERGLAFVVETEDGVVVAPCSPTDVWIALCGLLPRSAELLPAY